MKVTIVGGGNMGGAIALGLSSSNYVNAQDVTVINKSRKKEYESGIRSLVDDYSSLQSADIVILAVKPWLIEDVLKKNSDSLKKEGQILISVASGIKLEELRSWTTDSKPLFRVMPNTAIAQKQSMTFVSSLNATEQQKELVLNIFAELGKVELIDEKLFSAATALSGCGIAYAFRYIRAAMEGGVEMGLSPQQALDTILQTVRGAVELLETSGTHPEVEIDKVTTPGGITIKGLNEMERSGFSSSVINGLKASNIG